MESNEIASHRDPWNKGKIFGQKAPLKVKDVWALRAYLKVDSRIRALTISRTARPHRFHCTGTMIDVVASRSIGLPLLEQLGSTNPVQRSPRLTSYSQHELEGLECDWVNIEKPVRIGWNSPIY